MRPALLLCLLLAAAPGAVAADTHPFSIHDMLAMDRIAEPRVSPDELRDRLMWFGEGGPLELALGRGRLGVSIQDLTPELAEYFAVKDGVLVSSVEKDSPAAKAGIKAGDVITSVDGEAVTGSSALVAQLRGKEGAVSIGVSRDRKALTLNATLEKPSAPRPRIIVRGRTI